MLSIVPPNYFIDGATPFTSLISTSLLGDTFPIAWKITRPNTKIFIPAGTPVITIIPISLTEFSKTELNIYDLIEKPDDAIERENKLKVWKEVVQKGGFTNFYRDAVDYKGNKLGEHELKTLNLKINDHRER